MKKRKTSGAARGNLLRIFRIASALRARTKITAFDLADELSVCHKTICRDIDFLKDLGAPIYFKHNLRTWVWNPLLPVPWYFGGNIQQPDFLQG